jgi:hypothetical protein
VTEQAGHSPEIVKTVIEERNHFAQIEMLVYIRHQNVYKAYNSRYWIHALHYLLN